MAYKHVSVRQDTGGSPPAGGRVWGKMVRGKMSDLWRGELSDYIPLTSLIAQGLGRREVGAGPKRGDHAVG